MRTRLDAEMIYVSKELNPSAQRLISAYNAAIKSTILAIDTAAERGGASALVNENCINLNAASNTQTEILEWQLAKLLKFWLEPSF